MEKDKKYLLGGVENPYFNALAAQLNALRTTSPTYTPNPAYTTGLLFGSGSQDVAAKTGVVSDLLLKNLTSFMSGLNFQGEQRAAPQMQQGGTMDSHLFNLDPRLMNDPSKVDYSFNPNTVDTQLQPQNNQNRAEQPENTNTSTPNQNENIFFPALGERNRFAQAGNILTTDNPNLSPTVNTINKAIGGASAITSGLIDTTKDILSGVGTARQLAYGTERAAERMREASINQGFEQGRQNLFNQGYQQQGTLQFVQDGGMIPTSKMGLYEYPNQPVNVPSNNITMNGINTDVLAIPNGDQPVVMKPDQNYTFPNSNNVLEVPLMENGGMIRISDKIYFDNNTQEFVIV